ncbi:hypothetical protein D3C87_1099320 [compost metagenome]
MDEYIHAIIQGRLNDVKLFSDCPHNREPFENNGLPILEASRFGQQKIIDYFLCSPKRKIELNRYPHIVSILRTRRQISW